jgi:hypothetical protein
MLNGEHSDWQVREWPPHGDMLWVFYTILEREYAQIKDSTLRSMAWSRLVWAGSRNLLPSPYRKWGGWVLRELYQPVQASLRVVRWPGGGLAPWLRIIRLHPRRLGLCGLALALWWVLGATSCLPTPKARFIALAPLF